MKKHNHYNNYHSNHNVLLGGKIHYRISYTCMKQLLYTALQLDAPYMVSGLEP